jgi:hypothetical protein
VSSDAVAMYLASGLNATLRTPPPASNNVATGRPVAACHSRTVLSSDAVTINLASGLNATLRTPLV